MRSVYVVRTDRRDDKEKIISGVFDGLKAGKARIGWSYEDRLDLRLIERKVQRGEKLDCHESDARRCLGFVKIKCGDYLIYPHQPRTGCFSIAKVEGEYDYLTEECGIPSEGTIMRDFRSYRPCELITSDSGICINDASVPPMLRDRLKKPGRLSKVNDPAPFWQLLEVIGVRLTDC